MQHTVRMFWKMIAHRQYRRAYLGQQARKFVCCGPYLGLARKLGLLRWAVWISNCTCSYKFCAGSWFRAGTLQHPRLKSVASVMCDTDSDWILCEELSLGLKFCFFPCELVAWRSAAMAVHPRVRKQMTCAQAYQVYQANMSRIPEKHAYMLEYGWFSNISRIPQISDQSWSV